MVAWFIIALASAALFGFIAISNVQNVQASSDNVARVETARRLDAAADALMSKAGVVAFNSTGLFLPLGQVLPGGQSYGPPELGVPTKTPFGQPFIYCPFGQSGAASFQVPSADGSNYTIDGQTGADGGIYIVTGRPAYAQLASNGNIIGWLLAPRTKNSPTPSCDSVTYDAATKKFGAPEAMVRVLTRDGGIANEETVSSHLVTFYVSPDGEGKGATADDPSSLETALEFYRTNLPDNMEILFSTGYYQVTDGSLNINRLEKNTTLSLRHKDGGGGKVDIDMQGGLGSIRVRGRLTVWGVNFDTDTQLIVDGGSSARLIDTSWGRILNYGGRIDMKSTNTLVGGTNFDFTYIGIMAAELDLSDSTLKVRGPSRYGLYNRGASIVGDGARIDYLPGPTSYEYGLLAEAGSVFSCTSCTITFNVPITGHGIYAGGDLWLYYSNVVLTANSPGPSGHLIGMAPGARVNLNASTIGSGGGKANATLIDYGAASVAGAATIVRGSWTCWAGQLFYDAPNGDPGASSSVPADLPVPGLSDPITSAQVQARADAVTVNARRGVLRNMNLSSFTCQA